MVIDDKVPADDLRREALPYEAGVFAGKAFLAYRRRGGRKRSPLPDFYIGAHSAVRGYRLLTPDTAMYRTYFPTVTSSRLTTIKVPKAPKDCLFAEIVVRNIGLRPGSL